jgi:hypothetical protein
VHAITLLILEECAGIFSAIFILMRTPTVNCQMYPLEVRHHEGKTLQPAHPLAISMAPTDPLAISMARNNGKARW